MNNNEPGKKANLLPIILAGMGLAALIGVALIIRPDQGISDNPIDLFSFPPVELDQPAPELSLYDLNGAEVSLSDFQGEVVLLNNWATWCPPCRLEMPEFQSYYDKHKDQGFQVVAVEAGQPEAEVRQFVERVNINFVVLLDPENKSLETFQQRSLPNTFIIDRTGQLRYVWVGAIDEETLEQYVTPLLKE